jgi:predicted nucleic acid-binding protein
VIRAFLDASVLFAASYSTSGSSRDLLRAAIRGEVKIVLSPHVLQETEGSLIRKAPQVVPALHELLALVAPEEVARPSLEEVEHAAAYTNLADAPVVAAAAKAAVDYLVTWDRKHFLDDPEVARRSGLVILTPDELMVRLSQR